MKFPVSRISLQWHQPGLEKPNGTSVYRMYDIEEHDISLVTADTWKLWEKQVERYKGATLIKMESNYLGMFEWCIGWFNHWTFLKDRSDKELINSFHRHVNSWEGLHKDEEPWCLMSAEEKGRWEGPCHCVHCSESNVTRMTH